MMIETMIGVVVAATIAITVAVMLDIRSDREAARLERYERRALQNIARAKS